MQNTIPNQTNFPVLPRKAVFSTVEEPFLNDTNIGDIVKLLPSW